jgi:hypothetical protein
MSGVTHPPAPSTEAAPSGGDARPHELVIAPLLGWLAIQLLALAAGAFRLPLAVRAATPPEALADDLMVVAQVTAAALLLPLLFRGPRTAVALIACIWPMLYLAGFLASTPAVAILLAGLYVSAWLGALAAFSYVIQSDRIKSCAAAVFTLLALGGPVLWYARAEFFTQDPAVDWATHGAWGPVMGALAQLRSAEPAAAPWLFLVVAWLPAIAAGSWRHLRPYLRILPLSPQ